MKLLKNIEEAGELYQEFRKQLPLEQEGKDEVGEESSVIYVSPDCKWVITNKWSGHKSISTQELFYEKEKVKEKVSEAGQGVQQILIVKDGDNYKEMVEEQYAKLTEAVWIGFYDGGYGNLKKISPNGKYAAYSDVDYDNRVGMDSEEWENIPPQGIYILEMETGKNAYIYWPYEDPAQEVVREEIEEAYRENKQTAEYQEEEESTDGGEIEILEKSMYVEEEIASMDGWIVTRYLKYPYLTGGEKEVADRINEHIFQTVMRENMFAEDWVTHIEMTYEIAFMDEQYLSILLEGNVIRGGGYVEYSRGMNFDMRSGELLSLEEICEWPLIRAEVKRAAEEDELSVHVAKHAIWLEGEQKEEYLKTDFMDLLEEDSYLKSDKNSFFMRDGCLTFIVPPLPSFRGDTYVESEIAVVSGTVE